MDRSYIVESLPSHAGHPGSKVLLVHIWPTPDMPTYRKEWHRLGLFAKGGPQPGQSQTIRQPVPEPEPSSQRPGGRCTFYVWHRTSSSTWHLAPLIQRGVLYLSFFSFYSGPATTWNDGAWVVHTCFPDGTHSLVTMLDINSFLGISAVDLTDFANSSWLDMTSPFAQNDAGGHFAHHGS